MQKVYQYVDWLWVILQKEMKDYCGDESESRILNEEEKESLNWYFKELLLEESRGILNRHCASCLKKLPEIN